MRRLSLILLVLPLALSCSAQMPPGSSAPSSTADVTLTSAEPATAQDPAQDSNLQPTADRKIIYRAAIDLHVRDFAALDREIQSLLQEAGGYIARFQEHRPQGAQRGGQWTVRIPIGKFHGFLDAVGKLGVTDRREVHSDDATEEFVDLGARLKNKQALESRLLELVAKRGDNIKDVLSLEGELSRVREEIERMQGRLRYLTDRVALTTIDITAYERLDYRPPERTFAGRVAATFWVSLDRLREFGELVALVTVALLPWALAALVIALPAIGLVRWRSRRRPPAALHASVLS